MLHPVAFVALAGWPESPPAAIEIVKELGGSRQNTLRRVRRAYSEGWIFFVLHQSSTGFRQVGRAGCTSLLFSAG
jgi:hypothetical protein